MTIVFKIFKILPRSLKIAFEFVYTIFLLSNSRLLFNIKEHMPSFSLIKKNYIISFKNNNALSMGHRLRQPYPLQKNNTNKKEVSWI